MIHFFSRKVIFHFRVIHEEYFSIVVYVKSVKFVLDARDI